MKTTTIRSNYMCNSAWKIFYNNIFRSKSLQNICMTGNIGS